MRLSFHQRILLTLICLGAVPTAAAILGWGITIRSATPAAGPRQALEEVGATGRALLLTFDSTDLAPHEKAALAAHAATLNSAIGQFQRAETYGRYDYAGLGLVVFLLGAAALYASVRLGGHLSRQLSRPIEELIGWTGHIRRMEPLPPDHPRRGAPEFAALRTALREMATAMERGRAQEIEAERLRAFRETARRVAHEMRNPLTPIRLAVAQLARSPTPATQEAIEVITAESERLEQLAREFTEFGRLPEGPEAPVDLVELLEELARTTIPPTMTCRLALDPSTPLLGGDQIDAHEHHQAGSQCCQTDGPAAGAGGG
jgi:signal transduction histidine kinase